MANHRGSETSTPSVKRSCANCGKQMRLVHIEPSPRYVNLDVRTFICECGSKEEDFVARKE